MCIRAISLPTAESSGFIERFKSPVLTLVNLNKSKVTLRCLRDERDHPWTMLCEKGYLWLSNKNFDLIMMETNFQSLPLHLPIGNITKKSYSSYKLYIIITIIIYYHCYHCCFSWSRHSCDCILVMREGRPHAAPLSRWLLTCQRACLPTPAAVSKDFLPITWHNNKACKRSLTLTRHPPRPLIAQEVILRECVWDDGSGTWIPVG